MVRSNPRVPNAMAQGHARQNSLFEFTALAGLHILNIENPEEFNKSVLDPIERQPR